MSRLASSHEMTRDERNTAHHCAAMVVLVKVFFNQLLPVTWAEYYIWIEDTLKKLESSEVMQPLRPLHRTYHRGAQRCQNTSFESVMHFNSTDTSGFEYLGCTLAMSRPAIVPSYERLKD